MYGKCGSLDDAQKMFNNCTKHEVVAWNIMISIYAQNGTGSSSLEHLHLMRKEGIVPDTFTFVNLLDTCSSLENLTEGKVAWMIFEGMQEHNIVSYTTMITALGQTGFSQFAFHLFQQMPANDIQADQVSIVSILNACDTLSGGRYIHACIVTNGLGRDDTVEAALILMYSKHGSLNDSQKVMNKLETVLSWNAMLAAYAQHGYESMVFELYENMQENNILPDKMTFTIMIAACTNMTTLTEGRCVHAYIVSNGLESDIVIGNALVNMYGKCGQLEDANAVFLKMPQWNAASWNAIIANFCQYGEGEMAIGLFQKIYREGMMPNQITFLSVLSACSHAGLVDEASHLFVYMPDHAMEEHYGCMVDLLGHVGWLEEAEELMSGTPFHHCALLWKTLLAVCRIHGDVERAKSAAGHVLDFDPEDATAYILLANIYADVYTGKPLDAGSIFL